MKKTRILTKKEVLEGVGDIKDYEENKYIEFVNDEIKSARHDLIVKGEYEYCIDKLPAREDIINKVSKKYENNGIAISYYITFERVCRVKISFDLNTLYREVYTRDESKLEIGIHKEFAPVQSWSQQGQLASFIIHHGFVNIEGQRYNLLERNGDTIKLELAPDQPKHKKISLLDKLFN